MLSKKLLITRQPILAVAAIITFALSSIAHAGSADVVFGNLGSSGTGSLGTQNSDVGQNVNNYIAQGFTAAGLNLNVTSISLGLFGDSVPATIAIFADNFGAPAASPLFTSSVTNVGAKGIYAFSFTGANLTSGSSYWVIPQSDLSWYLNSPGSAPTSQNSSGYSFTSTLENFEGSGWSAAASDRYSISVEAVPEPSTYALLLLSGAASLWALKRRKS
jgi:hypothetical protein